MYCKKHENIGETSAKSSFNLKEYIRVMKAIREITCPECRRTFLSEPEYRNMTVEQFLEL